MYLSTPIGFIELMGIHPEWNARSHRWARIGRNLWRLFFVMKDDGPNNGRPQNPDVPFAVMFDGSVVNDWLPIRTRVYYALENLKSRLRG